MGFKTDWLSDSPQVAHDYIGILQWVQYKSVYFMYKVFASYTLLNDHEGFMSKFTRTLCLPAMHLTYSMELACSEWGRDWMFLIHLNLMVRDLFIWLFVVGGATSTYASSVDVLKWTCVIGFSVRVSVNAGFDGRPENINTISALPRLKISTTCMYNQLIFYIFKNDL